MTKLRRIIIKGKWLKNPCGLEFKNGNPMVGCKYCLNKCPHHKGTIKILFWEFVKCNL